jgi:signal transduction histidine kinase
LTGKDRVEFLLSVNRVLHGSLELGEMLPRLGERLVPAVADWCVFDVTENGRIERLGATHARRTQAELARKLFGIFPLDAAAPWGLAKAVQRGAVFYLPDVRDPKVLAPGDDAELCQTVAALGLGAVLCLPLAVGDRIVAVMSCVRAAPRTFSAAELTLLRLVAARTSGAVHHCLLYRESKAASQAKDEFIAMLGHELRNPIAAISHAVRRLDQLGGPDDSGGRFRAIVARQADHLARLVDDLLDVTRLSSGKVTLRREAVDLRDAVERCLALHEAVEAGRHDIAVEADSAIVMGDRTRIEQILVNLLENSIKYTPTGGQIGVRVRADGHFARLSVWDTGIGIAPELMPRIFDMFAQGEQLPNRPHGGLGIGLALVRRLVELHGGTVIAASQGSGKGTVVEVTLPLAPAGVQPSPPPATPPLPRVPRRRVLVVEDNDDAREALGALLLTDGHDVEVAAHGSEAIERARQFGPDVALVDIGLPGMDGYELARQLRTVCGPGLMLVALTGYGQPGHRQRALEAGFQVHLVKPVGTEDLSRVLALHATPTGS